MKIITISGTHKGVGKTTLACKILKNLKGFGAIKITVSEENISITSKNEAIEVPGKDTALLKEAGAEKVILISSPRKDSKWALKVALDMAVGCKGVIIEGTSILDYIKPDVSILIKSKEKGMKGSAKEALKKVGLVISPKEFGKALKFVKERMK